MGDVKEREVDGMKDCKIVSMVLGPVQERNLPLEIRQPRLLRIMLRLEPVTPLLYQAL